MDASLSPHQLLTPHAATDSSKGMKSLPHFTSSYYGGLQPSEDSESPEDDMLQERSRQRPEKRSVKRKKHTSDVWNWFHRVYEDVGDGVEKKIAVCKICGITKAAPSTQGTSHLKTHYEKCAKKNADLYKATVGKGPDPTSQMLDKSSNSASIGWKNMGDLDIKPFFAAAERIYSDKVAKQKALELKSLWDGHLRDPNWHPVKIVNCVGKYEEIIIDDEDEKLKNLKDEYGCEVFEAVTKALKELIEYDRSGRYSLKELWNFKEQRKASLEVAIEFVATHEKKRKWNRK